MAATNSGFADEIAVTVEPDEDDAEDHLNRSAASSAAANEPADLSGTSGSQTPPGQQQNRNRSSRSGSRKSSESKESEREDMMPSTSSSSESFKNALMIALQRDLEVNRRPPKQEEAGWSGVGRKRPATPKRGKEGQGAQGRGGTAGDGADVRDTSC